jgi:ABC-type proline/glycine betaine transport system ATPase subunit
MNEEISDHMHIANDNLKRIADALEEILRLVKLDQEKMAKRYPDEDQE